MYGLYECFLRIYIIIVMILILHLFFRNYGAHIFKFTNILALKGTKVLSSCFAVLVCLPPHPVSAVSLVVAVSVAPWGRGRCCASVACSVWMQVVGEVVGPSSPPMDAAGRTFICTCTSPFVCAHLAGGVCAVGGAGACCVYFAALLQVKGEVVGSDDPPSLEGKGGVAV